MLFYGFIMFCICFNVEVEEDDEVDVDEADVYIYLIYRSDVILCYEFNEGISRC